MSKSSRSGSGAEPAATKTEPSFEKAVSELERIVAQMEQGDLTLEQTLAAHRRGLELARLCQQRLEAAQQQVKVLEDGVLKPLQDAGAGDET